MVVFATVFLQVKLVHARIKDVISFFEELVIATQALLPVVTVLKNVDTGHL